MENLKWIGHASFKITGEKTIYIDPFKIKDSPKDAEIVFITHEHYDHCSIEDLNKVINPNTVIVATPDCQSKFSGMKIKNVVLAEPGKEYEVEGLKVETIRAYNIDKKFHPIGNDWLGYIITINGKRIYHAGDTDKIPEMANLKDIDIALMPVGGTYTMNPEEAAAAVNEFKPKLAIPMHYGTAGLVGEKSDAEKFKELSQIPVEILS